MRPVIRDSGGESAGPVGLGTWGWAGDIPEAIPQSRNYSLPSALHRTQFSSILTKLFRKVVSHIGNLPHSVALRWSGRELVEASFVVAARKNGVTPNR
jgi:hypothetical protein